MPSLSEMILSGKANQGDLLTPVQQGLNTGLKLAAVQQDLSNKKIETELLREQVSSAQYNKLLGAIDRGMKIQSPKARKAFMNSQINQLESMGMTFGEGVRELMTTDEYTQEQLKTVAGHLSKINGLDTKMTESIIGAFAEVGMLNEGMTTLLSEVDKQRKLQTQQRKEEVDVGKIGIQVNRNVKSAFSKIRDKRAALRDAYAGMLDIEQAIAEGKDPRESEIGFNALSRGIGKSRNTGALSEQDVADFRKITGLEELSEGTVRKWLTGGFSEDVFVQLKGLLNNSISVLDAEIREAKEQQEAQILGFPSDIQESLRTASGLDAESVPVLGADFLKNRGTQSQPQVQQAQGPSAQGQKQSLVMKAAELFKQKGTMINAQQIANALSKQGMQTSADEVMQILGGGAGQQNQAAGNIVPMNVGQGGK